MCFNLIFSACCALSGLDHMALLLHTERDQMLLKINTEKLVNKEGESRRAHLSARTRHGQLPHSPWFSSQN